MGVILAASLPGIGQPPLRRRCDTLHGLVILPQDGRRRAGRNAPDGLRLTAPRGMCTVRRLMGAKKLEQEAKPVDFETAMRDLEAIVERLEQGDMPLEESLAAFERGVMLTRTCQTALKDAEQKVEILLKKSGESVVEQFSPDET
jgi:exodeoxyribonuclease VII small subunit